MLDKKKIFFIFIAFGLTCSLIIGPFWDIFWHINIGERRLKYLLSFGQYGNFEKLFYDKYYPGVYDTISYFLLSLFPKRFVIEIYNIMSFLVGLAGIIGLKKFCKIHFGYKVSEIVFLLTLLTPIYFGQMLINPKDIMVASSFFWCLYYISKYFYSHESNKKTILVKIGFFIALGTGSKIVFPGLLLSILFILVIEYFFNTKIKIKKVTIIKDFFVVFITSYLMLVLFWPATHQNVITEPIKILFEASSKNDLFGLPHTLYVNKIVLTNNPPWNYIPANFLLKTPEVFLIIFFLNFFFFKKLRFFFKKEIKNFYKKFFYIILIILFPIFVTITLNLKLYDGLRNFLFILPLFNILISPIIVYFIENYNNVIIKKIILFIIFPLGLIFIINFASLTPYQYTYTNFINKYVYGSYSFENDYLATSTKDLIKKFAKINKKKKFKIASCVNHELVKFYLQKNNLRDFEIVSIFDEFDYAILNNRPINLQNTCLDYFNNKIFRELINIKRNNKVLARIIYR